ncbi:MULTISPECIES: putative bifunctional diguanylate cyclase/phosphodiesterase [Bacillaceae]|uniref:EAL domain-containing protein n=1 Tax=Evansella alkalicola TaxID=745819 RepID=A0ABS6JZ74_9BACI|nr:EAL domain-containing protein [Litchfieldia alkalitelluris]MBU9722385.1 EAL domain-containing protein [Bacillus alkalicola]
MSKPTLKNTTIFLSLFLLALLFRNEFHYIYGVTMSFATIFLFIFVRLFGLRNTAIVAILIHVLSVFLFKIPFWDIVFITEVLIIAAIYLYKNRGNLVLWGVYYWILVGIPLSFLLYYIYIPELQGTQLIFQVSIVTFNGLINVLIADIILSYLPVERWLNGKGEQKKLFNFQHFLFHVILCALLFSFILNITVSQLNSYTSLQNSIQNSAAITTKNIERVLLQWSRDDINRLLLSNTIQVGYLNEVIERMATEEIFEIVVIDHDDKIITGTGEWLWSNGQLDWRNRTDVSNIGEDFYQSLPRDTPPLPLMVWEEGRFIYEKKLTSLPFTITMKYPIGFYQERLMSESLEQLRFLLFFSIFAGGLMFAVKRILVRNLNLLAEATTGLPQKLKNSEKIEWPNSSVLELHSLIENFKSMSFNLANMFNEIKSVNKQLENTTENLKESEQELHRLAYYDNLTGLPNRTYFYQYLEEMLSEQSKVDVKVAVLFFDLNEFKSINDTLGHAAGDDLLKLVAENFIQLRTNDRQVFRLGGDEFVYVLTIENKADVIAFVTKIKNLFAKPFKLNDLSLYVTTSIGVSIYPDNGKTIDDLVKYADMAMYKAKEVGKNHIEFFDESMKKDFSERMLINSGLREAIDENQFRMVYQPKINIENNTVSGIEALIRWTHPIHGEITPDKFIPLAEESGFIFQIDEWAIVESCRYNKNMQDRGAPKVPVSVNMSAKHFNHQRIVNMVKTALDKSGLAPEYLTIEITETVFLKNETDVFGMIAELKDLGVKLSIDDFGIGYSSLTHLVDLPINEVKLDKNFIRNITVDSKKSTIVQVILELSNNLGLDVVAEGVETKGELEYLKGINCKEIQGFYFSKPLSKEEIFEFLTDKEGLKHWSEGGTNE